MTAYREESLALSQKMHEAREIAMEELRRLDRELLLELLNEVEVGLWAYATVWGTAYRLESETTAYSADADRQHAITALFVARVVMIGNFRALHTDGLPVPYSLPMLFVTSVRGRPFWDELSGGDR